MLSDCLTRYYNEKDINKIDLQRLPEVMNFLGYHYIQVVMETPYTFTSVSNAKVTNETLTINRHYTRKNNKLNYSISLNVESDDGYMAIKNLKIKKFLVKNEAVGEFIIECKNNIRLIIDYLEQPLENEEYSEEYLVELPEIE